MDNSVFDKIFSAASGVWTLVCVAAVGLFKMWPHIMARLNERQRDVDSAKSADWQRLRDEIKRLDDRCDHLQREVDKCHAEKIAWQARAVAAEAYQLGQGDARQQAATIVASERLKDRENGK